MTPLAAYLQEQGWDDAGRDCWAKHQSMEPSLVLRWLAGATPEQLQRIRAEAVDVIRAVDNALNGVLCRAKTRSTKSGVPWWNSE